MIKYKDINSFLIEFFLMFLEVLFIVMVDMMSLDNDFLLKLYCFLRW